jgi:hypothetical protein
MEAANRDSAAAFSDGPRPLVANFASPFTFVALQQAAFASIVVNSM